jgi:hypothetical protein
MDRRIAIVFLLGAFALTNAHAKKDPLTASTAVPAARGKVDIGKDSNGNTTVKITAEHLAEPGKLSPPGSDYVVWFQEKGAEPQTQGRLRIDKNLKGSFETSTPLKNFDIFVTAESQRQHQTTGGNRGVQNDSPAVA